jgi:hypothetical protein
MRLVELLRDFTDDERSRGIGQPLQLSEMLPKIGPRARPLEGRPDQERPLDGLVNVNRFPGDLRLRYRAIVLNWPVVL